MIEEDPDYAEYHFDRAALLRRLDRDDEAMAEYETAMRLSPPFPELYYNRDPVGQGLQRDDADDAALIPKDQAEAVAGVLFENLDAGALAQRAEEEPGHPVGAGHRVAGCGDPAAPVGSQHHPGVQDGDQFL